jgi:hypothetical protein
MREERIYCDVRMNLSAPKTKNKEAAKKIIRLSAPDHRPRK